MNKRLAALLVLVPLVPLTLHGPHGVRADTATPTATTTSTPTPTPVVMTPQPAPRASTIILRSIKAMGKVRRLHADGVVSPHATDAKNATDAVHLTADCDLVAGRMRIRLEPSTPGSGVFLEFVIFKHRDWLRSSEHPAWERDTEGDVDVLIVFLFPACPLDSTDSGSSTGSSGTRGAKNQPKVHLRNLGLETVDGVHAWHLRWTMRQKNKAYADSFYVDQSTYRWVRITVKQTSPQYYFDMHYSHFNEPVDIPRPVVGSTP